MIAPQLREPLVMAFGLPDTPTSELDAVNMVMKAKGLDLVTTLDISDAEIADAAFHLNTVDKDVQSKGWWFNKDYSLKLAIASDGTVPLPVGTLQVSPAYYNWGFNQSPYVERGGKLWDTDKKTFSFTMQPIVDITLRLAFEDLPEVARRYISILAAHNAQGLDRGNAATGQFTNQMVLLSLATLEQEQDKAQPNNQVHDNISVQGAVNGFGGMARSRTT